MENWRLCTMESPKEDEEVLLTYKNSAGVHVGEAVFKEAAYFYVVETDNEYYESLYKTPVAWMPKPNPSPYVENGDSTLNTWEMIKALTESTKGFAEMFFKTTGNEEQFLICFLRPQAGSIEFRCIDVDSTGEITISDNPIFYTLECWVEITKEEADKYLQGYYDLLPPCVM